MNIKVLKLIVMKLHYLKQYIPKKLFGRTILILLFPIILIELIVFVGFIQRHFEQVTNQMSESFVLELEYIKKSIGGYQEASKIEYQVAKLGEDFDLTIKLVQKIPILNIKNPNLFDFSGKAFVSKMRESSSDKILFDFSENNLVKLYVEFEKSYLSFEIPRKRISASNPHQLLVLMVSATIFFVFVSLIILRNQIRPIIRLAEAADAFGKGVVLPYKPNGSEEVKKAGVAFLSMRTRLEKQIEQRTQMLSGVSHDLRTPLTRLKLSLSLLKNSQETKDMLEDVNSMQRMLDEFLTFAKDNSKEEIQTVNPTTIIETIIEKNLKFKNNIKINIKGDKNRHLVIPLRPRLFERAIQNLIENAQNYAKKIYLGINSNKKFLIITIEDDGPGIPANARELAVKPFSRLDQSRNQNKHSGVGLGLAIALDTVRAHGGNMVLEKSKILGGLKVKISMPL